MILISNKGTMFRGKHRFARSVAAATLAFSTLSLVNGCAGKTDTPSGGEASATATASTQNQYDSLALQTFDDIVQGNVAAVTARFDPSMQQQLSPDGLAGAWKTYQEQFGSYQSHEDPQDVARGEQTVVNVPLRMEREPGEFRVTFNKDGSIAGLYFLKTGVPVS